MDQEDKKCDANDLLSSPNLIGVITLTDKEESAEFQEGGIRGWATVMGAILIQFCGPGYSNAFGVFQDYYTRIYITNESSSTIAWIGSVTTFLIFISGIHAGGLYDRGYFYHLLYGGSFLISFSLFMLPLIKPNHLYQNFLAQGVGYGLGCGMIFVPSLAVVSHYFKKKRTLAMTFVAAGSSLGALIHPIMLNNLLSRVGLFFFKIGFYYPFFYLQLDASKHGMNEKFTFYVPVIMHASSLAGRLSPGFFPHALGVVHMVLASATCCSALILSMSAIKSATSFVVIAVLYGYATGIYVGLEVPLIASLAPDISELGTRLGIAYILSGLGGLVGPPIHGALLSSDFVWWRPAVASGICALIGASCFGSLLFRVKETRESQV